MLGPVRFRFLNETHDVMGPEAWNDPACEKLWLYNLHYFDDLNAADADSRRDWHQALLARWVRENPPGRGNGWEPYPTSLRIVNWVKYYVREAPTFSSFAALVGSLAVQARWLSRRLEFHLLGNHLFANAKALVFAGAFFVGPEAERWLRLGQRLLRRELQEQVLADGGHFERSPMYHAILLEDVLDLVHLSEVYPGALDAGLIRSCREQAEAMLGWLAAMSHPDGGVGFFNDAAFRIAPPYAALADYAEQLGIAVPGVGANDHGGARPRRLERSLPLVDGKAHGGAAVRGGEHSQPLFHGGEPVVAPPVWLRDSGYVRLATGPAVVLLDVAPIGPDYLPGHAHADTLSFELSLFGQRVIVNGGTSRYGSGRERQAERGTAAHSTIQIDAADSSEVWGGFRVARRARPFDVAVHESSDDQVMVSAAHDGYRRLAGRPVHRRGWELQADRLVVSDRIEGDFIEAVARFHLHPAIEAEIEPTGQEGANGRLLLPSGESCRWRLTGGSAELVPSAWHPEFGLSEPTLCLTAVLSGREVELELRW
jgi:uncharacterized heparinase superfamily protein